MFLLREPYTQKICLDNSLSYLQKKYPQKRKQTKDDIKTEIIKW